MSIHSGPAVWWTKNTDAGRYHVSTKGINQSGLILNLDAGVTSSYPGTGTTWYDLSGNGYNATLYNGVIYDPADGGRFLFDGTNDYVKISSTVVGIKSMILVCAPTQPNTAWHYLFDTRPNGTWFAYTTAWAIGSWTNHYLNGVSTNISNVPMGTKMCLYTEHPTSHDSTINLFSRYSDAEVMGGYLYSVQVYNRALSSTEILKHFNIVKGRYTL